MASSHSGPRQPAHLETPGTASSFERPKLTTTTTRTTAHRLPPPALFQGPPSKNASHISLVLPTDRVPGAPSSETENAGHQHRIMRPSRVPPASSFSGPSSGHLRQHASGAAGGAVADDNRAEQLWAEMQKTLADVELSAMNTSHVFGASHLHALEDLRAAQLSLAQTWAKTETDELLEHDFDTTSRNEANVGAALEAKTSAGGTANVPPMPMSTPSTAARAKGTTPQTGSSPATAKDGKDGKDGGGKPSAFTNDKNLEEETERDIQLARKRREANDRYFSQVNRGVLEVVSKLDEVAGAMRRVERESREIWDESTDEDDTEDERTGGSETEEGDADGEGGSGTERSGLTDSPVPVRKDG
ncbi:hypothetical protein A1O7_02968 [Cladophialophora yegresii CBS 114405]|uniref:Uncharacterized protein n=1 Tax=Cladophialophora yegresii CBS 114405 TaxID=1182544 RepID=W9WC19_9EURO|nr:uncharacterized protein A1O7_02968 [Cladophialophora yegresii CBS 114405]EXJ62530.1 hypothetical protein A1O7_02968 [Cladophialophora yegresii CBS 114405]